MLAGLDWLDRTCARLPAGPLASALLGVGCDQDGKAARMETLDLLGVAKASVGEHDFRRVSDVRCRELALGRQRAVIGVMEDLTERLQGETAAFVRETALRAQHDARGETQRRAAAHSLGLLVQAARPAPLTDAAGLGLSADAVRLLAAAKHARQDTGAARVIPEQPHWDAIDARLREHLGDDYEVASAQGVQLTLADALEWACRMRGPRTRPTTGWHALTPTEAKIADLVAHGLTNRQIGERMFISRETVKTHLGHIFNKLGVRGRAQLAALAATEPPTDAPTGPHTPLAGSHVDLSAEYVLSVRCVAQNRCADRGGLSRFPRGAARC